MTRIELKTKISAAFKAINLKPNYIDGPVKTDYKLWGFMEDYTPVKIENCI